jgi:sugar O-acyltransferase (sialic acid O-acetyltransferase NeuD family)
MELTYTLMEAMEQNRKKLYIIGAGGFGRELELWMRLIPETLRDFKVEGFIDDNPNALDGFKSDYKIVGTIDDHFFETTDYVVISIAEPGIKENIFNRLKNRVGLYTFIAPSAIVGDRENIGPGSVICPNAIVSTNTKLGKCVTVNCGTQLGHDSQIGDFASFMANVMVGGATQIGSKGYFGSQSTLVPGKKVCDNVKISAGSVVIRNISKPGVYFGNPAKLFFT